MKRLTLALLMMWFFASMTPAVFADRCGYGHCPTGEHSACYTCGEKSCGKESCPITAAIMKKSCFLLGNAEELGLSDDQMKKIKSIKMETKKQYILTKAQMEAGFIDLKMKLHEDTLDMEGLNAMADQFAAGFADATKKAIQNYAALKGVVTADQMAKAKKMWMKKKQQK
jgi:hypothetical protein